MKRSRRSNRSNVRSNFWDNPVTPKHKALYLACKVLSEGCQHEFPPEMRRPEPDLSGVTLADSLPILERMMRRAKNRAVRSKFAQSLAILDQRCAALRDSQQQQ